MTPYAHRYINTRATLALLVLLLAVFFGWRYQEAQRGSVTLPVQAKVVAADPVGGSASALPLLLVELPDGSRLRLHAGQQAGGSALAAGDTVTLMETTMADGSRRYHLQARRP